MAELGYSPLPTPQNAPGQSSATTDTSILNFNAVVQSWTNNWNPADHNGGLEDLSQPPQAAERQTTNQEWTAPSDVDHTFKR